MIKAEEAWKRIAAEAIPAYERAISDQPTFIPARVALAELADDGFTGIGVSCGGGMFNVCVAYKTIPAITFSVARGGDWIDNIYNGPGDDFGAFDETAWRLQAIWNATDSFSAYLKLHGFSQDGSHPNVFYANAIEVGKPGLRPGFDEEVANHDNDVATLELDHVGGALNLQWVFGNGMTLTSITGYDTVDNFQSADVDGGEVSFDPADLGALGGSLRRGGGGKEQDGGQKAEPAAVLGQNFLVDCQRLAITIGQLGHGGVDHFASLFAVQHIVGQRLRFES